MPNYWLRWRRRDCGLHCIGDCPTDRKCRCRCAHLRAPQHAHHAAGGKGLGVDLRPGRFDVPVLLGAPQLDGQQQAPPVRQRAIAPRHPQQVDAVVGIDRLAAGLLPSRCGLEFQVSGLGSVCSAQCRPPLDMLQQLHKRVLSSAMRCEQQSFAPAGPNSMHMYLK